MKNIYRLSFAFILVVISSSVLMAQEIKKFKYGKVDIEELKMTSYEKDTSANAVVLQQYAEFNPSEFTFLNQFRIKILKQNGTSQASIVLNGKIKQFIKGCTYNLENGQIVKSKLENESIFEEKVVGQIYRTRIAMPNVKVGSVFELQIFMNGLPNAYEIQRNIPVIYGAIYFPRSANVNIRITEIGNNIYSFRGDDKWVVKDLPAFEFEPYITSDKDYRLRLEFEVLSYSFTNSRYLNAGFLASSWADVTKNFSENVDFVFRLSELTFHLNSLADSLKKQTSDQEELAKLAFENIKRIKWNGQEACFASHELRETYKLKQGNSADINFNLINLLKKLGLKSYPVLFSTRDNGKISNYSPTLNKFNYVIAAVDLPSGTKYLDASDEFTPYGLPTERIIQCLGHPLEKGKIDCSVIIDPLKKRKNITYSQLKIDSTGKVDGNVNIKRYDYDAIDFKNYLKSKPDHETFIRELESENSGWYINDYKFNNLNNPYMDFSEEFQVGYSNSLNANSVLFVNPFAFIKTQNNPFQKEKRYNPVSFPQQTEYSSIINISIPKNYQVSELPKSVSISNNDKTMQYVYKIQYSGNTISISTKFIINKFQYETVEYPSLRGVFEMMIQKQNESIVLKRI